MKEGWALVLDLLIALSGALLLGLFFERIRLNAIIGYLLAGAIVGPGGFALVSKNDQVLVIAEIGVALLLFTIGLEFSWKSVKKLGAPVLLGGVAMILAIIGVAIPVAVGFGLAWQTGFVIGAACALSSTAIVIRVLRAKNDLDSRHGKTTLGVLLVQDIAVVPLVLAVTFMGSGSKNVLADISWALASAVLLVLGLIVFVSQVVPRLLHEKIVAKNRELPIILAIVTCVGATWAAHELKISPALGAFFAGMLLAESKFSHQMRADVLPLRTLFVTLFFVSVGLLADVTWMAQNIILVLGMTLAVIAIKVVVTYLALRFFIKGIIEVLAAAIALGQIGEFSFVIMSIGKDAALLPENIFQLLISTTLLTLFVAPFTTGNALRISRQMAKRIFPARKLARNEREIKQTTLRDHLLIIGYGEAGQATCLALRSLPNPRIVVDLDPRLIRLAEEHGHRGCIGDATSHEILESVNIHDAEAVLVTISDHHLARLVVAQCKSVAPDTPLVVRARYHIYADELGTVGANDVVDEEMLVGERMGEIVASLQAIHTSNGAQESDAAIDWQKTTPYN